MFNSKGSLTITPIAAFLTRATLMAILVGITQIAPSQEALRNSLAGEEAAALRHNALQNASGNLRLGMVSCLVGSSFGVEWNDNVGYSDANQQQDFILRPAVSLVASMPLTEQNGLFATLDAGYAKYVRYSQYDRFLIAPGTQLAFDAYVKDFHFDFHDDVAVTEHPIAEGTISGTGDYGEFSNLAGIGVDWDLNEVIASFGYDHQTAIATTSGFSYLDRSSDNFVLRGAFQPSQAWSGGPEATAGWTTYEHPVLNDSENYSLGGFLSWDPKGLFQANLRAGYSLYSFHSLPHQAPVPDASGYYMDLRLSHRLNDIVTLALNAGRQIRLGVNSDLLDLWYAHPTIDWRLFEKIRLDTHFTFENGTESRSSVLVANEDYTLLGAGIGTGYQLMEKLLLSLTYDYAVKDSNLVDRDYHQHKVQLQIQYTF
jgi:hypothetical protein